MPYYTFLNVFHILSPQPKSWWQTALDALGLFGNIAICACTITAAFIPEGIKRFTKKEITYSVTLTPLPSTPQQVMVIEFSCTGNEDIEPGDHSSPMEIDLKGRQVDLSLYPEIIHTGVIPTSLVPSFFTFLANYTKIALKPFKFRRKEKFTLRFIVSTTGGTEAISVNDWIAGGRAVEYQKGFSRFARYILTPSLIVFTAIWLWYIVSNRLVTDVSLRELTLILWCMVCFIVTTTWIYIRRPI